MEHLSADQARRIALAAQGFLERRPAGRIDRRHVDRVVNRLGYFQLDSVNVLVRAHYMPLFARLGPYDPQLLDRMAYRDRTLFEYWGHGVALIPTRDYYLFRWRMDSAAEAFRRLPAKRRAYIDAVFTEVEAHGPISANQLADPGARKGPWWGYSDGKRALEHLVDTGRLVAGRRGNFERVYDVPERVLPAEALARAGVSERDGRRELLAIAARALGVGTLHDLAEYWYLRVPATRPSFGDLVESGEVVPVTVEGWDALAFLHKDARVPRAAAPTTLLSPFDPLLTKRDRVLRLFDFHYRIEIFVPEPKRIYGYYVLPFLHEGELVARVDLKADRKARRLLVLGAWAEEGCDRATIAEAMHPKLVELAGWLGLDDMTINGRGDLAPALQSASGVRVRGSGARTRAGS